MKPTVITKLAAQTADNYHAVLEVMGSLKSHLNKVLPIFCLLTIIRDGSPT